MKAKFLKNRKVFPAGTALMVALLVMGVLMAISLALSTLVLRESIVTREFLDAGQSFYAAESASEIGLYGVKNSLPGWEPKGGVVPIVIDGTKDKIEASKAVAELKISNKCKAYPCFDKDYDTNSAVQSPSAFYATLGLNESATIPLFVLGDDGTPTEITGFTVEFFANFHKSDFKIKDSSQYNLSDWDVMRWKIVGLNDDDKTHPVTESISDFTAVTSDTQGKDTDALKPSWFGTMECDKANERYKGTEKIDCVLYGDNWNLKAREFYEYKGFGEDRQVTSIHKEGYFLEDFIKNHKLNYLTLTNLINPSVLNGTKERPALTKLSYRIELFTDKNGIKTATDTVRDYADITADGYSGKSKQSVNVKIKRDSFMPVFNFSLYSTYMDKSIGHGEKYWYGDKKGQELIK